MVAGWCPAGTPAGPAAARERRAVLATSRRAWRRYGTRRVGTDRPPASRRLALWRFRSTADGYVPHGLRRRRAGRQGDVREHHRGGARGRLGRALPRARGDPARPGGPRAVDGTARSVTRRPPAAPVLLPSGADTSGPVRSGSRRRPLAIGRLALGREVGDSGIGSMVRIAAGPAVRARSDPEFALERL